MQYRFARENKNYADFASGRVFYGMPGHPAFPVRLASEIFGRCMAARSASGIDTPCVLYDPCCGGAYLLTTMGYVHWDAIDQIVGSDVDVEALALARRNLDLLTVEGMNRRIGEIESMLSAYGKSSHAAALESAQRLRQRLLARLGDHSIETRLFRADVTDAETLHKELGGTRVDVVITDVPYGQRAAWRVLNAAATAPANPIGHMLTSLRPVLAPGGVVAVVSDKRQKVKHEDYTRVERFQVGKRRIVLLKK